MINREEAQKMLFESRPYKETAENLERLIYKATEDGQAIVSMNYRTVENLKIIRDLLEVYGYSGKDYDYDQYTNSGTIRIHIL